jgi:inhibitor of cysteine peptidase
MKNISTTALILVAYILLNLVMLFSCAFFSSALINLANKISSSSVSSSNSNSSSSSMNLTSDFKKFANEKEFLEYISNLSKNSNYYTDNALSRLTSMESQSPTVDKSSDSSTAGSGNSSTQTADRFSTTNVQTEGVDEEDLLKTDGKYLYFSKTGYGYYYGDGLKRAVSSDYYPGRVEGTTTAFNLLPVDKIDQLAEIKEGGTLMLNDNILIINNSNTKLTGYDVSDPVNYKKLWSIILEDGEYISFMRSIGNELYFVMNHGVSSFPKCEIPVYKMTSFDNKEVTMTKNIRCTDIYFPSDDNTLSVKNTIEKVDFKTGKSLSTNSFLTKSSSANLLYMSNDNMYLTYNRYIDPFEISLDFFVTQKDIFNDDFIAKLKYIDSLSISSGAKYYEINTVLTKYLEGLSREESLKVSNNLQNNFNKFVEANINKLVVTDIVKLSKSLDITARGSVPGYPLNQFSMDEYNGNLRIATNLEGNISAGYFYFNSTIKSTNTVTVLDKDLKFLGEAVGLGSGERIYSARFVGDTAYIVTFRQTDPFYVLDLSNPKSPKVVGELKIPGYSSYLHELKNDIILGVGDGKWKTQIITF